MVVSFVGCPCSGKTTTAAMVFATLKEHGVPAEFIPEQARMYIANERVKRGLSPQDQFSLTDSEQVSIMTQQVSVENVVSTAVGPTVVVVTDSSPFNSLMYMSPAERSSARVQELINKARRHADLVFYAPPINVGSSFDPNRLHSSEESKQIDSLISEVMKNHAPDVFMEEIYGSPSSRTNIVVMKVLAQLVTR